MIASAFAHVPFEEHALVHTADLDEARQRIGEVLNSYQLQVVRGKILHSRLEMLPCASASQLRLLRLRHGYGADIKIDPHCGTIDGYYLLVLPSRGQAQFHFGGRSIDVTVHSAAIFSPDRRFHFSASSDYEQILLRLERSAIDSAWRSLTAHDEAPPICFEPLIAQHTPAWQALGPMLQWVARCSVGLQPARCPSQAALLAQTETLLATSLLLHQPHDRAMQLWPAPLPAAPQAIRRAQAYMREHIGDAVPVAMVASHCGLSVRRLQALFQDECGQSPLQWLRTQRLLAVRQALMQAGDEPTAARVGETALRFGFNHLGEFSRAYRAAFGQTPQETRQARQALRAHAHPGGRQGPGAQAEATD